MGAGLQIANRANRNQPGSPQNGPPKTIGKSLSFRATAQVFYKYNSTEGEEQAVSPQVDFERVIANSKASVASFAEEIQLTCPTKHRHHVSIVVRVNEDTHGRIFEVELHAHKYLKSHNYDGKMTFRESIKYKVDPKNRNPNLSDRWYNGIVGFKVEAGGNIKGSKKPSDESSSTKVAPMGKLKLAPFVFKLTLKSIMQAPPSSNNDPEHKKREMQKASSQRRQVCMALLIIFLFLGSGAVFYPIYEGWTVLDSFYWGMVTITTVGYGDMGPVTVAGRVFTSFYVMAGVGIIGVAVGIVGGYVMEQQEKYTAIMLKEAQELALADHNDESSDSDDDADSTANVLKAQSLAAKREMELLKRKFDASPLGCLYRFGMKWLKIFTPVSVVLGIGMAVMMTQEPMDPQITLCDDAGGDGNNGTDCLFPNQTYKMTFVNAIYWGLVTGTTVGYGDISPTTDGTKIFSMFFLVFAVITTANALSTVGDALMASPGKDAATAILARKLDAEFLMSLDMDGSGDVTEFEYLAAMLIQLNHVDEDQIDSIMKAFRKLDIDGSGSLSVSDLANNLKSERKKRLKGIARMTSNLAANLADVQQEDGASSTGGVSVPKSVPELVPEPELEMTDLTDVAEETPVEAAAATEAAATAEPGKQEERSRGPDGMNQKE